MSKKHFLNLYIYMWYGCIWLNKIVTFKKILTLHSVVVSSSPNLPLPFVIVFWGERNRRSLWQMFFKTDILKNFANITGKHQCWSLFLIKLQAWRHATLRVLSCEICDIFKKNFFQRKHPVAASEQTQEISAIHCVAKLYFGHLAWC